MADYLNVLKKHIPSQLRTELRSGLKITTDSTDSSRYILEKGEALFYDYYSKEQPQELKVKIYEDITFDFPQILTTSSYTYIYLNPDGSLGFQLDSPQAENLEDKIYLGLIATQDNSTISLVIPFIVTPSEVNKLSLALGVLNLDSPKLIFNSYNLTFGMPDYRIWSTGRNHFNNQTIPSLNSILSKDVVDFTYQDSQGNILNSTNLLDFGQIEEDNNNIVDFVEDKFTVQRIYSSAIGAIIIQIGTKQYDTLSEGLSIFNAEDYNSFEIPSDDFVLIGAIAGSPAATSSQECGFIPTDAIGTPIPYFASSSSGGSIFNPDEIAAIRELIASDPVQVVSVVQVTTDSITLEWIGEGEEFKVFYREISSPDWILFDSTTDKFIVITGLLTENSYEVGVRVIKNNIESGITTAVTQTLPDLPIFQSRTFINIPGANNSKVICLTDNTPIRINDLLSSNPPTVTLNKGETYEYASSQFDVISFPTDKNIYVAGRLGSCVTWVPGYLSGKEYAFGTSRNDPQRVFVWAVEEANVELIENTTIVQSLNLNADAGGVVTWSAGGGDHSYLLRSTGLIIPFHYSNGVVDPKPLMPTSLEIIGTPSSRGKLYTSDQFADVTYQESDGDSGELLVAQGGVTQIPGTGTLFSGASTILRSQELIAANSLADRDGSNNTPFIPVAFLQKSGGVPYDCDFVKFFSNKPCSINIYNPDGSPWVIPTINLNGIDDCWEYRITGVTTPIYFESNDNKFGYVWQDRATDDETIGLVYE